MTFPTPNPQNSQTATFQQAFDQLADGLLSHQRVNVGSFWEFLRDIWCLSFDNPEYFKAWHVGVLAEDIEQCIQEGKNYVAVLPRFHFKSTILGHAFSVWRLLTAPRDCSVLYLSYSDGMARYHIAEINKAVQRNPILTEWMKSRSPKADFSFRYHINNKPMEIGHGGLFSFKRGMHVNGALIADDVLRDPDNPLNLSQLYKVEDHFLTESMFIPLKGVPVIVLGTPMMPGDLLTKLQDDERFKSRVLPALDPVPGRRVLMPELYNEEWLLQQQKARPKSFASEFMLIPHSSTESYFDDAEIRACEDKTLQNYSVSKTYPGDEGDQLFAGFDVGKKRHPSHLVIFKKSGTQLTQVHQSWLDGWSYSDQIQYLNDVVENFPINKGYIDNTRGELEDRGLNEVWKSMSFTVKSKNTMTQVLENYVTSSNLKLLVDERQRQQIISVNNNLKAPETPLGHGDAFFSIAMASLAAYESSLYTVQTVGNVADWMTSLENGTMETDPSQNIGNRWDTDTANSTANSKNESKLGVKWDSETPIRKSAQETLDELVDMRKGAPNPQCVESICNESFWVPANNLCLLCGHRG